MARGRPGRVQTGWGEGRAERAHRPVNPPPGLPSVSADAEIPTPQCGAPVFKRPLRAREGAQDAAAVAAVGPSPEADQGRGRGRGEEHHGPGPARTQDNAPQSRSHVDTGIGASTDPYLDVEGGEAAFNFEDMTSGPTGGDLLQNREQDRLSEEADACLQRLLELTNNVPLPEGKKGAAAPPVILWFRQDLRLHDNPALVAAAQSGRPVIPVYLHVPVEDGKWPVCGAAKYWLHHALLHLSQALDSKLGSKLLICSGESSLDLLLMLIMDSGATTVLFNRVYEPWKVSRDALIAQVLSENGVSVHSTKGVVLFEPIEVRPDTDQRIQYGFGSVGFFLNACDGHEIQEPLPVPLRLRAPVRWPQAQSLSDLRLDAQPRRKNGTTIDWAKGIRENWGFREEDALAALEEFVYNGCFHFEGRQRFRADRKYTAVISPYMRFGQLSPRTVFHAVVQRHRDKARTFLRRLAWRDLAYWMLWKLPCMADEPIRPQYAFQWWDSDAAALRAWQRGYTGYPLVDAAMRQLWVTGWMPNYMRHVVAGTTSQKYSL